MSKSTFLLAAAAVFGSTQILHHGNASMDVNCNDSSGPICIDSRFGNPSLELAFDGKQFICGINAENPQSVRCPIGTCCSKWGYCGPDIGPNNPNPDLSPEANKNLYCNADSSGDWRVVSCDSKFAVEVKCDDLSAAEFSGDSAVVPQAKAEEDKCIDKRHGNPTWKVQLAPDGDGDLCGVRSEGKPYRCPFGMCCSKLGYCGPARAPDGSPILQQDQNLTASETEALYCDDNAGDWRYISCASEHAVFLNGTSPRPVVPKVKEEWFTIAPVVREGKCIDKRYGDPTLSVKRAPDGDLCGIRARAKGTPSRCPFGMCCSKYGYCGPHRAPDGSPVPKEFEALYCDANAGDWRYISCASEHAVFLDGTSPHPVVPKVEEEEKCIDNRFGNPTLSVHADAEGDLCGVRARAKGTLARCPFGMCCSKYGYCGPHRAPDGSPVPKEFEAFYCDANAGDWRYISCASEHAVFLNGTLAH